MGVIEDFVASYRREFDFYDQSARLVQRFIEVELQSAGVRAIVTSRAKAIERLEPKVRDRAQRKNYGSTADVYADIPDLAGVRVALYFPGQREQVGQIINRLFAVVETKVFPDGSAPKYPKRFSGYSATHFRIRLREDSLPAAQKRYAEARVEVQVASVLMHAWAEVDHDLVYKPFQGALSEDEYAILDELNGMMIAGEIGLERLQRAGAQRIAVRGRIFANHFDLAAHLLSALSSLGETAALQTGLGRVDLLYELLARLNRATPDALGRYLPAIHANLEVRPIAEQIVDQLLAEDPNHYAVYEAIRAAGDPNATGETEDELHRAIGEYVLAWSAFEEMIRNRTQMPRELTLGARWISTALDLDQETRALFDRLRQLRNWMVHGTRNERIYSAWDVRDAIQDLAALREAIDAVLP